jgi:hypothetical protein
MLRDHRFFHLDWTSVAFCYRFFVLSYFANYDFDCQMSFVFRKANPIKFTSSSINSRSLDLSLRMASTGVSDWDLFTAVFRPCLLCDPNIVDLDSRFFSQAAYFSPEGEERKSDSKVVRCTCSKSKNMPFCDGAHRLPWYKLSFQQNIRGVMGGWQLSSIASSLHAHIFDYLYL